MNKIVKISALILAVIFAGCYVFYKNSYIDFDRIVEKSVLKGKTFDKKPIEFVTPAGIKVWLLEDKQIKLISMSFAFNKAGTAYDAEDKKGVSSIAAQMLDGGTKYLDYAAYHDLLDLNGIYIGFSADRDYFSGFMTTPSTNEHHLTTNYKDTAFETLKKVLYEPRLDENYLKTLQMQFATLVKTQKETPKSELNIRFKKELFKNHPYSRTVEDMAEDVAALKPQDIKEFLQNSLVKENIIVSFAGDITKEDAIKYTDYLFNSLKENNDIQELNDPEIDLTPETVVINRDTAQVISSFALKGVKRLDADFYPLYIANYIFGGSGLTSRISLETREKEGLTYGVYTYLSSDNKTPLILGSFSCVPENYEKMKTILFEQMDLLATKGITKKELDNAKKYLLASYNLRFKSTLELSNMLTEMQKYKLGLDFLQKRNDYVRNVTLQDVNNVIAKYYKDKPKEVAIGLIK